MATHETVFCQRVPGRAPPPGIAPQPISRAIAHRDGDAFVISGHAQASGGEVIVAVGLDDTITSQLPAETVTSGWLILSDNGPVPVAALRPDDLVCSRSDRSEIRDE